MVYKVNKATPEQKLNQKLVDRWFVDFLNSFPFSYTVQWDGRTAEPETAVSLINFTDTTENFETQKQCTLKFYNIYNLPSL